MNSKLVSACALAGIALTVFGAGSASAETAGKGSIGFIDNNLGRGENVEIFGTCDDPNFTTAPVVSDVLDMPDLYGADDGIGGYTLKSLGQVKDDAAYGTWPVHFMCGTTKVETTFTVVARVEPFIDVLSDKAITPGSKVTVSAMCGDPEFAGSKVTSTALTAPDLVRAPGQDLDERFTSNGRINADVKPGKYDVTFTCAGMESTAPAPPPAQVPVKPKGAADTGALDTATVAPTSDEGPGIGVLALGGVALLGAGGLGVAAYRRRQHS